MTKADLESDCKMIVYMCVCVCLDIMCMYIVFLHCLHVSDHSYLLYIADDHKISLVFLSCLLLAVAFVTKLWMDFQDICSGV